MKNTLSLVFAGMIGGALTLGGSKLIEKQFPDPISVAINKEQGSLSQNAVRPQVQLATNQHINGRPDSFTAAAELAMPTVVNITAIARRTARNRREQHLFDLFGTPSPSEATGSGVIISNKGYIVTNNHVIKGATQVEVTLYDKRKFKAQVIGTDPSTDLAVLQIEGAKNLPVVKMADSDEVRVGEWVLAVGNPFELTSTVTAGIVSAKGRNIGILDGLESFIQTDAAVNPGNSGGALVNDQGELIGINTAIIAPTGTFAGYSFAVPINLAKKVVKDLIDFGEVRRAFLGIMIHNVNDDVAKELNLSVTEGVYVNKLIEGGAALDAGMRVGDVVVEVNGNKTRTVSELQEQIGSRNPGDDVRVKVNRNGALKEIIVELRD